MNTNLVNSVADASAGTSHIEVSWGLVLWLMLIGAVIGSATLTGYEIKYGPKDRKSNGWLLDLLINLIIGIGAVALVPVFLRTISSTLFSQMDTSMEARFVFTGFCAVAAFASKRFLGAIPQKVLDSINDATEKGEQNKERIEQVVEAVANKTAKTPPALPDEAMQKLNVGPVHGYNAETLAVIRALLNPKWPTSRSLGGIAFDSGLTFPHTEASLRTLQQSGDVVMMTPESVRRTKDSWWGLTAQGRKRFGQLGADMPLEETGLE